MDLSDERAALVQLLNAHDIPVIAWLLLPEAEGYWFNLHNYPHALVAYRAFRHWTQAHQLRFAGVGLDIEPALSESQKLQSAASFATLWRLSRARHNALFPAARNAYTDLVVNIRHDGYQVYAYQLPFVVDDRRAGTTLVQRMFDVVDLPVDEEVLMCYSSLLPTALIGSDLNGAFVSSYGVHADGLAIGSTGGGVIIDPVTGEQAKRLGWEAFVRDLRIAARYTPTVHIFSLEGCVAQGWLTRIPQLDWTTPVIVPRQDRLKITFVRGLLATVLFGSRFGVTILGWLGWALAGWLMLRRHARPWRIWTALTTRNDDAV